LEAQKIGQKYKKCRPGSKAASVLICLFKKGLFRKEDHHPHPVRCSGQPVGRIEESALLPPRQLMH
jgi:hypothetical protein